MIFAYAYPIGKISNLRYFEIGPLKTHYRAFPSSVRSGPRDPEGPLQLRLPEPGKGASERELHRSLLVLLARLFHRAWSRVRLVGSGYSLEVGGQDFRIDHLFYHLRLRCYVAVELKNARLDPGGASLYSNSKLLNSKTLQFSVTVRMVCSFAPSGISASISIVTVTFAPSSRVRCWITS